MGTTEHSDYKELLAAHFAVKIKFKPGTRKPQKCLQQTLIFKKRKGIQTGSKDFTVLRALTLEHIYFRALVSQLKVNRWT